MASGQDHDKYTLLFSLPFTVIGSILYDIQIGLLAGAAFVLGGLWFSPDLDTNSIAFKRWGMLKIFWWPYRKLIPHRSIWSHGPFIGTLIRVIYLISLSGLIMFLLKSFDPKNSMETIDFLKQQLNTYPKSIIAIFIGLEASVWLHLIQDGDP